MAVLDEFVVEIGLDGKKFAEGRASVDDEWRKLTQSVDTYGKDIEARGQKISDVFTTLKMGAAGILGVFVGSEAAKFVEQIASMDGHTMRLAHSIGLSTKELSLWQNMVRAVGGNAADASQTLGALNDSMMQFQMGQALPSTSLTYLAGLAGVNLLAGGSPSEALMKLTGAALRMPNEQQKRFMLSQIPGMNEGMMFLALSGQMDELKRHFEALGVASEDSGKAAADFQQKAADLETSLENLARVGFPALTAITNALAKIFGGVSSLLSAESKGTAYGAGDAALGTDPGRGLGYYMTKMFIGQNAADQLYPPSAAGAGAGALGVTSRGDRNNNPGNIKFGPWAAAHGATSQDSGGFAIFPSLMAGNAAMAQLLHDQYQGLTLAQIERKWVGNSDSNYLSSMMSATGLKAGDVPNLNDNAVIANLMRGMMKGEGTHGVARSSNDNSVTIGSINVTSSKADPKAVADQIPDAIKRSSMLAGVNTGLA